MNKIHLILAGLLAGGAAAHSQIIVNEFLINGSLSSSSYIEFLVTQDISLNDLNNIYFGDLTGTRAQSIGGRYKFNLPSDVLPSYANGIVGQGTIITVGAVSADLDYHPLVAQPNDNAAWNIALPISSQYITTLANGSLAATIDGVWLSQHSDGSTPFAGIAYKYDSSVTSGTAYNNLASSGNIELVTGLDRTTLPQTVSYIGGAGNLGNPDYYYPDFGNLTTSGSGNGGDNDTYITTLRSTSAVPEPHEYAMMVGLGLLAFAGWRKFKTAKA